MLCQVCVHCTPDQLCCLLDVKEDQHASRGNASAQKWRVKVGLRFERELGSKENR